jgi:hypothetical protein
VVLRLVKPPDDETDTDHEAAATLESRPLHGTAGAPNVLVELKQYLETAQTEINIDSTPCGPDQFPLAAGSPLIREHETLSALFGEIINSRSYDYGSRGLLGLAAGHSLLKMPPADRGKLMLAAAERHVHTVVSPHRDDPQVWRSAYVAATVADQLQRFDFHLARDELFDWLLYQSSDRHLEGDDTTLKLVTLAEHAAAESELSEGERYVLWRYRASIVVGPPLGVPAIEVRRLTKLIGDGAQFFLVPGETWTDGANEHLTPLDKPERQKWSALFQHTMTATPSRPSRKWLKTATALIDDLGSTHVRERLATWLPLVPNGLSLQRIGYHAGLRGANDVMNDENATCLKGLLWVVPTLADASKLVREITSVALSAYKKVPGVGPRAVKVGNAAVYALSAIGTEEAVGQLAILKVRVKFNSAQKEIEKAFRAAAEALGLSREEIEELGVPSYGLEKVGLRCESFGEHRAELAIANSNTSIRWFDARGKSLKSVPAKVKSEFKEDLKELQQSLKDVQAMLPAQRDRIDSMFLLEKSWPFETWRQRYLAHALVGVIAQRLIWRVDGTPAVFVAGQATDVQGRPIEHGKTAEITLWHPVGCGVEEITSWRARLEELSITQPFKQAHREVYLLTDAERNTRTYSNRYAAHILRQHQFNALCGARGWKNKLRLMVDDDYPPPSKELPQWGLRAEFWVEGVGEDYGGDTNDAGVFLRLATDQVRFYRVDSAANRAHAGGGGYRSVAAGPGEGNVNEPLPLDEIPPLVFSEIMRDVDSFVGVASLGNDPAWQDGGPEGRYRDYWHHYSFGELSGTATTRKQVLQRLIPRLKISSRCSFSDRFLVVQGDIRSYKIHLGSGNILMEPNDQYLCIVPDSYARASTSDLFLPFEGDATLSIILSKALLLAEDKKIKDPTIVHQIGRKRRT